MRDGTSFHEHPRVVAFDLSLTSTGYALAADTVTSGVVQPPKAWGTRGERLARLTAALLALVPPVCDLVVIEDLPMHAKSAGLTGQLHGAVKAALYNAGHPAPLLVAPATLKTFATGRGNADKVMMVVAARDRLGYDGVSNDEADALWLCQLGMHVTEHPGRTNLPATHLRALDKVRAAA